jgi:hypothetical protein
MTPTIAVLFSYSQINSYYIENNSLFLVENLLAFIATASEGKEACVARTTEVRTSAFLYY